MTALADDVVAAGIIGLGLELFATRFLIEKVSDHLTAKLIGRGLPSELQAHIKEIVATACVRTDYVKSYKLGEPDQNGNLHLEVKVQYKVSNHSDSLQHYTPMLQEELFHKPRFIRLEYSLGKQIYTYDAALLSGMITTKPGTNVQEISGSQEVKLRPIRRR